jgi:putative oxidoreductase
MSTPIASWFRTGPQWASLPLRLALGIVFIPHGAQKLFGWFGGGGMEGTAGFLASMGMKPGMFWAIILVIAEFVGGLALLAGLATRVFAALLTVEMLVAIALVHGKSGFFLNWYLTPNVGHGFEYNLALIGGLVALLILGGGRASVDATLKPAT